MGLIRLSSNRKGFRRLISFSPRTQMGLICSWKSVLKKSTRTRLLGFFLIFRCSVLTVGAALWVEDCTELPIFASLRRLCGPSTDLRFRAWKIFIKKKKTRFIMINRLILGRFIRNHGSALYVIVETWNVTFSPNVFVFGQHFFCKRVETCFHTFR